MEVIQAHDFTGGQTGRLAATHFTERQWAELYGFVLDSDAQLRAQWSWEPVGPEASEPVELFGREDEAEAARVWLAGDLGISVSELQLTDFAADAVLFIGGGGYDVFYYQFYRASTDEWFYVYEEEGVFSQVSGFYTMDEVRPPPGAVQVAHADDLLVALDGDGRVWTAPMPAAAASLAAVRAISWTALSGAPVDADQRLAGLVPLPRSEQLGFVTGLLVNGATSGSAAFIVYDDGSGPAFKSYANRYPTVESSGMPRANLAAMWGDFLVLGDVEWMVDKDATFGASNRARYEHALWISEPGQPDRWDELRVVFTGIKDGMGSARVVGLETVDAGLMVLTTTGVYLLRGLPSDFEYEELRPGQGVTGTGAVSWWSATGAAAWVNDVGQLWHSDGRQFLRLDDLLELDAGEPGSAWVTSLNEFLLFGRDGRTFAFRVYAEDGAWTELFAPDGFFGWFQFGPCLYGTADGRVWRLNRVASPRGAIDGQPQTSRVTSRTFEGGDGHRLSFWRRYGLRAQPEAAGADLTSVTLFTGPALQSGVQSMSVPLLSGFGDRQELLVPGPGAALESSIRFEFVGDVTVEQVSAHYMQSRGSR